MRHLIKIFSSKTTLEQANSIKAYLGGNSEIVQSSLGLALIGDDETLERHRDLKKLAVDPGNKIILGAKLEEATKN